MKVKVLKVKREGFISRLGIEFETGLILYTASFVWAGNDKIKQTAKLFGETVVKLRKEMSYACESCSLVKADVVWREETEQYECGECYMAWCKEQGLCTACEYQAGKYCSWWKDGKGEPPLCQSGDTK